MKKSAIALFFPSLVFATCGDAFQSPSFRGFKPVLLERIRDFRGLENSIPHRLRGAGVNKREPMIPRVLYTADVPYPFRATGGRASSLTAAIATYSTRYSAVFGAMQRRHHPGQLKDFFVHPRGMRVIYVRDRGSAGLRFTSLDLDRNGPGQEQSIPVEGKIYSLSPFYNHQSKAVFFSGYRRIQGEIRYGVYALKINARESNAVVNKNGKFPQIDFFQILYETQDRVFPEMAVDRDRQVAFWVKRDGRYVLKLASLERKNRRIRFTHSPKTLVQRHRRASLDFCHSGQCLSLLDSNRRSGRVLDLETLDWVDLPGKIQKNPRYATANVLTSPGGAYFYYLIRENRSSSSLSRLVSYHRKSQTLRTLYSTEGKSVVEMAMGARGSILFATQSPKNPKEGGLLIYRPQDQEVEMISRDRGSYASSDELNPLSNGFHISPDGRSVVYSEVTGWKRAWKMTALTSKTRRTHPIGETHRQSWYFPSQNWLSGTMITRLRDETPRGPDRVDPGANYRVFLVADPRLGYSYIPYNWSSSF